MQWHRFLFGVNFQMERQALEDAVVAYSQAILKYPNHAEAFINRACTYMELGETEKALADADQAIEKDPSANTYLIRGRMCAQLGLLDRALADYNYVLEREPKNAQAYLFRGRLMAGKKEYNLARQDFDKAVGLAPRLLAIYLNRGWLFWELGEYEKAMQDADKGLTIANSPALRKLQQSAKRGIKKEEHFLDGG